MGFINLLSSVGITSFGDGFGSVSISLAWLCKIITWIINIAGDVGLGIILFTVALKLITLPLDIYSRASMKKNSLKMEMMKDDLQKLQKQYANNQQLYQQKMMALYKKNGYSAFSSCLPTIITLVFFIVVINAFNAYSRFTDKEVFNEMGRAYSVAITDFEEGKEDVIENAVSNDENGDKSYSLNIDYVLKAKGYNDLFNGYNENGKNTDLAVYSINDNFATNIKIFEEYKNLKNYFNGSEFNVKNSELTDRINSDSVQWIIGKESEEKIEELKTKGIISEENSEIYTIRDMSAFYSNCGETVKSYILCENIKVGEEEKTVISLDYAKILNENSELKTKFESYAKTYISETAISTISKDYLETVVYERARIASRDAYYENRTHSKIIFWVKNVWVVDSPFSSAIPSYEKFCKALGNKKEDIGSLSEKNYNEITYYLSDEKQTGFGKGNGYFVLVALSILTMLLSTVIMNKTQKTQMQLSTVDGENSQSAATAKMMTWMMPIMFGVFAFIYSASFSIYMIMSSLLSTCFTLLINLCVERSFKGKLEKMQEEKNQQQKYGKRR